jgi:hypothetical protein
MYRLLLERGFISPDTRFMLLFIGDKLESPQWSEVIDKEIEYCRKSTKSTAKMALDPDGLKIAENAEYATTTWSDLIVFNDKYTLSLDTPLQQVEQKLLLG